MLNTKEPLHIMVEYHSLAFPTDEIAQQFATLYTDFYATVRSQWRRGYQFYPQLEKKPFRDHYTLTSVFPLCHLSWVC